MLEKFGKLIQCVYEAEENMKKHIISIDIKSIWFVYERKEYHWVLAEFGN